MMSNAEVVAMEHNARIERAWAELLSTEGGRHLVHDLMNRTGLSGNIFTPDASTLAYLEGRRSIGVDMQNVYLAAQGAQVHAQMLIEAEARALEMAAAMKKDLEADEEY